MARMVAVTLAAVLLAGCADFDLDGRDPAPPSRDSSRVRGDDVARLFTVPRLPMLRFGGRASRVACEDRGSTPGRGGRWHFWRCSIAVGASRRSIDVMWQIDDPEDAPLAPVDARDRRTGRRADGCCIDRPLQATAADVGKLFTEPYETLLSPGDGVITAGCRPGRRDRTGLGNPWRCTLETDSEGTVVEWVRVTERGRFTSGHSGGGCCVRVAPRARRGG